MVHPAVPELQQWFQGRVTHGDRELQVRPLSCALCTSLAMAEIRRQRSLLLLADRTLSEHWLRPPLHRDPTALHSGCLHSAVCAFRRVLSYPSPPADRTEVHFMKLTHGCTEGNSSARFAPFAEIVCLRNANSSYLPKNRELGPQIKHSLSSTGNYQRTTLELLAQFLHDFSCRTKNETGVFCPRQHP